MSIALDQAINYRSKYEISVSNKTLTPKNKSGYSKKRNIGRKIINVFMILSILVVGFFGVNSNDNKAAQAIGPSTEDICKWLDKDGVWYNGAESPYMSPTGAPSSGKITAYEKYGVSGLNWTVWRGPVNEDSASDAFKNSDYDETNPYYANGVCIPFDKIAITGAANMIFSGSKIIVFASGLVYQLAFEKVGSLIAPMQEQIAKTINPDNGTAGLKDTLYLDFIIPMIMLSALYLAWVGLVKRKSSEALTSAVWMMGSAITGLVLLTNPMMIPNASNSVVKNVTEGIMGSITNASSENLSGVGGSNLCAVDESDQTRKIVRTVQCSLWYSFLYVPWATGQYGVSPSDPKGTEMLTQNAAKLGGVSLDATGTGNDASPKNWPIYQLDQQVNSFDKADKDEAWSNIPEGMLGEPGRNNGSIVNNVWAGEGNTSLISKALFSLIAAAGSGMMILILGISMIVFEIGLIILMMMAPLFLLIGVHPGFGRRIALKWVETIISLTLKRVVLSVLLGVMITFYSIVIAIPEENLPWFGTVFLVIAISIAGLKYKDVLTDMFSQIDLGGGGGLKVDDTSKASGALKGAALGATVAAGGMLLGSNASRASNVVKGGNGKATRPKSLDEFSKGSSDSDTDTKDKQPNGKGGGGGNDRNEPDFDTDDKNTDNNKEHDNNSNGNNHDTDGKNSDTDGEGNRGNGNNNRPDDPEPYDDKEESTGNSNNSNNNRPDGADELNGNKPKTKEERAIDRAHTKRAKLDDRLNKRVAKSTRPARVAGGMKTMVRASANGAMLGYRGSDPGFIAMSANQSIQNSRAGQKAKTNDQVAAARRRQVDYNKAWKEYNSADSVEAKSEATARMDSIYKGMSSKERNYIKGVKKVNQTAAKATGGSLPPRRPSKDMPNRKHADPGALPPRPTNR